MNFYTYYIRPRENDIYKGKHEVYKSKDIPWSELHRLDGPALIYPNNDGKFWYRDGQKHRDPNEGPAVIFPDGRIEYWVKGQQLKELSQKIEFIENTIKLK